MLKLLGVSAGPEIICFLGLAMIGFGVVRGGLLPMVVGVLLLGWAAARAVLAWRG